jgi:hypothetical protein
VNQKKTFWMNVIFAISWALFCLIFFATDIDYIEHTLMQKIITLVLQLFIFATLIITAIHFYKSNSSSLPKLAIFGNYTSIIISICSLLFACYSRHFSFIFSIELLILLFIYSIFILPFLINLKELKVF